MTKNDLFEYVVYKLDQWYKETHEGLTLQITKLRLQKILFLLCAVNATKDQKGLLIVFDRFAALPLGPVELDIYEAMKDNQFSHIHFDGDDCRAETLERVSFEEIDAKNRQLVDDAVVALKAKKRNYLTMPIFDLVDLTHQWSAWQTAKLVADIFGHKSEAMSAEDICGSRVKAY